MSVHSKTHLDGELGTRIPSCVIIEAANRNIHKDRKYIDFLRQNGIKIGDLTAASLVLSEWIGTRYIAVMIVAVLLGSTAAGYFFGCNSGSSAGCQVLVYSETRTTLGDESSSKESWSDEKAQNADVPASAAHTPGASPEWRQPAGRGPSPETSTVKHGDSETSLVTRQHKHAAPFSLAVFQASIIVCAFILAFSRWIIENRQSSMSELFERKKEVNLLLLKDEKGVLTPLISEALRIDPAPVVTDRVLLDAEQCETLHRRAMMKPLLNDIEPLQSRWQEIASNIRKLVRASNSEVLLGNAEFLRQMFVYIELDNFELSLNRYGSGLLGPEQMYRSWEIIQSRCLNPTFRYMAAVQGLKYYTDQFHWALRHVLIRTEYLSQTERI